MISSSCLDKFIYSSLNQLTFKHEKFDGKNNIIIHGNLTCSIISKIIGMNFPGKGSLILEQKVLFPNPIFPNDLIRFKFTVKEINTQLNTILISVKAYKVIKVKKKTETVLRGNVLCLI